MNALGTHILMELRDCNCKLLDDLPFVQETLLTAARTAGATIIGQTFHKFSPQGVTGVVAIAESHLCIHTWPEHGYAAADIFTRGEALKPDMAADYMVRAFQCQNPAKTVVKRGILADGRPVVSSEAPRKENRHKVRQGATATV